MTMAMASFFITMTMASFLLMFFPDDSFNKLENLLRFVFFFILTAIFGTLALIVIIGSGVQFLIIMMINSLANIIDQFMAEINMDGLDMDDFEEARMEEEKPKLGRNARRRKKKMAKRSKSNEKKMPMDRKAQQKSLESKEKPSKIQNEIEAGESEGKVMSKDLEAFLKGEIKNLEDELECPVCLEVAKTAPIYKCEDDHLLCRFFFSPSKPFN